VETLEKNALKNMFQTASGRKSKMKAMLDTIAVLIVSGLILAALLILGYAIYICPLSLALSALFFLAVPWALVRLDSFL
jgi:hypothetical protein